MTRRADTDMEPRLEAFLEPGPRLMSEALAVAIRDEVHQTRQRRGMPRWEGHMHRIAIPVAGLGLLAVATVAIVLLTTMPRDVVAPGASGSPRASASLPASGAPSQAPSAAPSVQLLAPLGYPEAGTIGFTRRDPATNDAAVWLVRPDGSDEVAFGPPAPLEGGPEFTGAGCCALFSPDGSRVAVAYEAKNPAASGTLLQTMIIGLDGRPISSVPVFCGGCGSISDLNYVPGAWSPDGTLLALETWYGNSGAGIAIAPVESGTSGDWATAVAGAHDDIPIAFSPDGSQLLFLRLTDGDSGSLMVLTVPDVSDAAGRPIAGDYRQVSAPGMKISTNGYFGPPASWSPDGQEIAFAATDPSLSNGNMRIWVVAASGGDPRSLTADRSIYTGAAWSPDGQWIALDRVGDGQWHDLFVIRPDGSDETNLTEAFAPGICCSRWSPDATALLAAGTVGRDESSYLFIVPIDGSMPRQVTTTPAAYEDFSWGPASR